MDIKEIVSIATIGLLSLFALLGFWLHYRQKSRTLFGALLSLGLVLLNIILSIFIADIVADAIVSTDTAYKILDTVNGGATEGTLAQLLEQMEISMREGEFLNTADLRFVFVLLELILSPIIFILSFILLGIVFFIIKLFLKKLLPETGNIAFKLAGGAVGAIKNVLIIVVILVPLVGFAAFGFDTVNKVNDAVDDDGIRSSTEQILEYEEIVTEGPLGVIHNFGGQFIFEILTTTHVDDVKVSLTTETNNAIEIYKAIVPVTKIDSLNFTEHEVDLIDEAIDEIEKSDYLTALVASILSQASNELYENESLLSFERPKFGESYDPVVDKLLEVLSKTEREDIVEDIRTFAAILRGVVENGVFRELNSENGDIFVVLENSEFYSSILQALYANERTRPIVPTIANTIQSFLYEVYEEINGFPYGTGEIARVDEGKINVETLNAESIRIAIAVREIRKFANSTAGAVYVGEMVKSGDFVALGTALNQMRDSIFFGNLYEFLLNSILHSEACEKLGIFDANFVNSAIGDPDDPNDDADMVTLLVSRQNLAKLTMALWDGDKVGQEDALKIIISNLAYDENDPASKQLSENEMLALMELAELGNLEKYGVGGKKGITVSNITETLMETIHDHIYADNNGDGVVDQTDIDMEASSTAHIITVIAGAHEDSETGNMFGGEGSKTGESASDFISNLVTSSIATELIDNAVKGDSDDPFGIQGSLSKEDKANLQNAISNEYKNNTVDRSTLENIAQVFGVDFIP